MNLFILMNNKKLSNVDSKQRLSLSSLSNRLTDSSNSSRTLPQFSYHSIDSNHKAINMMSNQSDDEEEEVEGQSPDKMKTMFMSLWNNVKFGQFYH